MEEENIETNVEKSEVEKVKENLNELRETNDAMEKELLRGEELRAKRALGGKSNAGEQQVTKTEEEVKVDGAKEFFKGTSIEDAITEANG